MHVRCRGKVRPIRTFAVAPLRSRANLPDAQEGASGMFIWLPPTEGPDSREAPNEGPEKPPSAETLSTDDAIAAPLAGAMAGYYWLWRKLGSQS
jgi:hypothetical protein